MLLFFLLWLLAALVVGSVWAVIGSVLARGPASARADERSGPRREPAVDAPPSPEPA